jgi:predicted alpha/beta-hydrolase family hydrolase
MARLGVLLAPGASADRNQPALVAIDDALTAAGYACSRMDFPYRTAGRRAPDREPVLLQAVVEEATAFCAGSGLDPRRLVLGGRSMGGRICSLAVAQGLVPACGLILISYPLHPPGRPDRLRNEHFPRLSVPCLFVSGTRDAFASPEELEAATAAIRGSPGSVTHVWIEGKDHGLRRTDREVAQVVLEWVTSQPKPRRPRG